MALRQVLARTPTLAFTLAGRSAEEVSRLLADQGIFASHGNFYAMTVVERLGVADRAWSGWVVPVTRPTTRSRG